MVVETLFYLLNVRTLNALVLYDLSRKQNEQLLSIVDYKRDMVMTIVEGRIESVPEAIVQYLPLWGAQRN